MPIFDIYGQSITDLAVNNINILNIEFGAGRNYFGKSQFPQCYLTDKKIPALNHFTQLPFYDENSDCHYLDFTCDFYDHDFSGHTFEKIILCNPHGFGYSSLPMARIFFNRVGILLRDNGQIVVLSSHTNKFGKKRSLEDFLNNHDPDFISEYIFVLDEFEELNHQHEIRLKYTFKKSCLTEPAIPSQKMIIRKVGLRNNE